MISSRAYRPAILVLPLLLALATSIMTPSLAEGKEKSRFYATQAGVMSACKAAGGRETDGFGHGGYGCIKANCDGKKGHCSVECTAAGDCTGFGSQRSSGGNPLARLGHWQTKKTVRPAYQPPASLVEGNNIPGAPPAPPAPPPETM